MFYVCLGASLPKSARLQGPGSNGGTRTGSMLLAPFFFNVNLLLTCNYILGSARIARRVGLAVFRRSPRPARRGGLRTNVCMIRLSTDEACAPRKEHGLTTHYRYSWRYRRVVKQVFHSHGLRPFFDQEFPVIKIHFLWRPLHCESEMELRASLQPLSVPGANSARRGSPEYPHGESYASSGDRETVPTYFLIA